MHNQRFFATPQSTISTAYTPSLEQLERDYNQLWVSRFTASPAFKDLLAAKTGEIRVLEIGIGQIPLAPSLANIFRNKPFSYLGLDYRSDFIKSARSQFPVNSHVDYQTLDLLLLGKYRLEDFKQFDIIILRHPNTGANLSVCKVILESALPFYAKPGALFVTSFYLADEVSEFMSLPQTQMLTQPTQHVGHRTARIILEKGEKPVDEFFACQAIPAAMLESAPAIKQTVEDIVNSLEQNRKEFLALITEVVNEFPLTQTDRDAILNPLQSCDEKGYELVLRRLAFDKKYPEQTFLLLKLILDWRHKILYNLNEVSEKNSKSAIDQCSQNPLKIALLVQAGADVGKVKVEDLDAKKIADTFADIKNVLKKRLSPEAYEECLQAGFSRDVLLQVLEREELRLSAAESTSASATTSTSAAPGRKKP